GTWRRHPRRLTWCYNGAQPVRSPRPTRFDNIAAKRRKHSISHAVPGATLRLMTAIPSSEGRSSCEGVRMAWLADSLLAAWKLLRSFVTRNWNLEDYPVRVEYFPDVLRRWVLDGHPLRTEYHSNVVERQVRCPPWSGTWFAHVINWPE